jgi:DNA-directed RNA polymerase subunit RPC12/RpoP
MPTPRGSKAVAAARRPGTYVACQACGRLLRIEWRTRSIVCACGSRVIPTERSVEKPGQD